MKPQEHRKHLNTIVNDVNIEDILVYLYGYAKQGKWLRWDYAMQVDTFHKKLLYVWTPELLSYHDQLLSSTNRRP